MKDTGRGFQRGNLAEYRDERYDVADYYPGDHYRPPNVTLGRDDYVINVPADQVTLRTRWDERSVAIERSNGMLITRDAKDDHVTTVEIEEPEPGQ